MGKFKMSLVLSLILSALVAQAGLPRVGDPQVISQLKAQGGGLTSKVTFKKLQRAYDMLGKEKYDKALNIISKLEKTTQSRNFEYAQVFQAKGMVLAQKGQYSQAIPALKKALSLNGLSYSLTTSTMYSLAQLYMGQGQSEAARQQINQWFLAVESAGARGYILNSYIELELGHKKRALDSIEMAMGLSTNPKAAWLQLAAMLQVEFKNYHKAARYLEQLILMEVDSTSHWKTLVGVYLNLDQYKLALATMELAFKKRLIKSESEIVNLVSLQIQNGIPYWGAKLLQQSLESGYVKKSVRVLQLLAQGWVTAEESEKAIPVLKKAAKLDKKGKTSVRLGQIYLERENWAMAHRYISRGLKKGGLSHPERAHLALGIVYFNQKKISQAKSHFLESQKSKLTKNASSQWLKHLSENG